MHDITAVSDEQSKQGEYELIVPDGPDAPLIIKIIPFILKLPTIVKQESKEGEESAEKDEEKEEGIEESHEEVVKEDTNKDEVVLDDEDTID